MYTMYESEEEYDRSQVEYEQVQAVEQYYAEQAQAERQRELEIKNNRYKSESEKL